MWSTFLSIYRDYTTNMLYLFRLLSITNCWIWNLKKQNKSFFDRSTLPKVTAWSRMSALHVVYTCDGSYLTLSVGPRGGGQAMRLHQAPQIIYYKYHSLSINKNNIVPVRESQSRAVVRFSQDTGCRRRRLKRYHLRVALNYCTRMHFWNRWSSTTVRIIVIVHI
jgi:hypothetical protein